MTMNYTQYVGNGFNRNFSTNVEELEALTNQMIDVDQVVSSAYVHFGNAENWERKRSSRWLVYAGVLLVAFIIYCNANGFLGRIFAIAMAGAGIFYLVGYFARCRVHAQEEAEEGTSILLENREVLYIIPQEYLFPYATSYILKLLEKRRVFDINTALQRCDEYLHRASVEQNQNKTNEKLDAIDRDIWLS